VVGRPNVGKSTLVNTIVGEKVTITSSKPGTTRRAIRGVLHAEQSQAVLVDTPGLHKPRSVLGERLNENVGSALADTDVVVALVDARSPVGPGDRRVLESALAARGTSGLLVAVNKIDVASRSEVVERLVEANEAAPSSEVFAISGTTGEGVDALVETFFSLLPEGPPYFPEGTSSDLTESFRVAEMVREALLSRVEDELPHSIACRVTDWEWPYIRLEILVERESQKGIVIGRGGSVLKEVGSAVRQELPVGTYLDLKVRVEPRWQQRRDAIERLGY